MTLLDILPSLRSVMPARLDPAMWPSETHYDATGRVAIGGVALQDIADQYGTPVWVLDVQSNSRTSPPVARCAMVSVHRVRSVVRHDDGRTVVAVDGSLANAKYAVVANRHSPGPFISATIVPNDSDGTTEVVQLPADLHPGEVLAAPWSARTSEGSVVAVTDGRTTELIPR